MVAFVDPRHSKIDIAQAVGRAMRKPRGGDKKVGYIVVPIFAQNTHKQSIEEAIKSEEFDDVAIILNSLLEQDEELIEIVKDLKQSQGRGEVFNPIRLKEKIEVTGPSIGLDELVNSIYVQTIDRLGESWDEWFGRLTKFKEREGHCRVPISYAQGDFKLGTWTATQRATKENLSEERIKRLDSLGFIWDPRTELWEEGFSHFVKFIKREGHSRISFDHLENDYKLGQWITSLRTRQERLTEDRIRRLDDLGFIWDPLDEQWEEGFSHLVKFKEREGHSRVAQGRNEGTFPLGSWVSTQRRLKEKLSDDRIKRLDDLGFIWDPLTEQWEEAYSQLVVFIKREGHCDVAVNHIEGTIKLGSWVGTQRRKKDKLSGYRIKRLDDLGFIWDPHMKRWEEGFNLLIKFKEREGHCRVPATYKVNDFFLGTWVRKQRIGKDLLSTDRLMRLDAINFIWAINKSKQP